MSRCCESATAEPRTWRTPGFPHFGHISASTFRTCGATCEWRDGHFRTLPVTWDCLHGDLTRLPTSADALSAAELTTLNDARGMLLAVCAVDQISEASVDSLLSQAWQGQEAPLVLAARVLRRICAIDE